MVEIRTTDLDQAQLRRLHLSVALRGRREVLGALCLTGRFRQKKCSIDFSEAGWVGDHLVVCNWMDIGIHMELTMYSLQ